MKLKAEGWELFYDNGTTVSSKDMSWEDAPIDRVVVMLIWHKYYQPTMRMKTIFNGRDYYYYISETEWGDTNDFELVRDKSFKRGVWVTNEDMDEINRRAFEKRDF